MVGRIFIFQIYVNYTLSRLYPSNVKLSRREGRTKGIALRKCRQMERQTDGETDRWRDRQMERQTDGKTDKWRERQVERKTSGEKYKWRDRQMERQTGRDRQMERQTDGEADR